MGKQFCSDQKVQSIEYRKDGTTKCVWFFPEQNDKPSVYTLTVGGKNGVITLASGVNRSLVTQKVSK